MSPYEEAYAETLSHTNGGEMLWLGLHHDQVSGQYLWTDEWPVWFTAWGPNEPSGGPGEGCAALLPSGGWNDTSCTQLYKPLCKYSTVPTPTEHPDVPGYCPDDSWTPYGRYCYRANNTRSDTRMSWPEAQFTCSQSNASLASLHTRQQLEFVRDLVGANGYTDVWIGLTRGVSGGFEWVDDTPVDFTNWYPGEPTFTTEPGTEDCVEMYLGSGKWNDVSCLWTQGYVCQMLKLGMDSPGPTHDKISTGLIIGITVGGVVLIIAVVTMLFFVNSRKKSLPIKTPDPVEVPGCVSFDNALYRGSGINESSAHVQKGEPNIYISPESVS